MVRVVVLGMGMAASHYIVGLERIKMGDVEPYGVPLAGKLPIDISEIEVVGVYDVDTSKVGKSVYEVAKMQIGSDMPIPESLKEIKVYEGVHLRNLDRL
ncbi:TPA: myo-inositol-1-phosphate synthase, partial [Candidatus Geothermarchaeota archaeon]|nr:myo-inositol-1-phosphate synthase [Candidatus Geothermarchaeota archaeon]